MTTIYLCPDCGYADTDGGFCPGGMHPRPDTRMEPVVMFTADEVRPLRDFAEMALAVTPEGPNGMLVHKAAGKALDAFPTTDKEQT